MRQQVIEDALADAATLYFCVTFRFFGSLWL